MLNEPSLFDAFRIESPLKDTRTIPLSALTPMGTGTNVELNENFVFEFAPVKRALYNLTIQQPVWCWGPSGCGKTEFYAQIAARLNRPCHIISFGEETSQRELLGSFELTSSQIDTNPVTETGIKGLIKSIGLLAKNGMGMKTKFTYGHLIRAISDPMAIVVLDEFNMAPPGVAAMFNRLLECGEITIPETGETIRKAEGVVFAVAANTPGGMDESGIYAGSQIQNGATRSRFSGLRMHYLSSEKEVELLQKACPAINAIEVPDTTRTGAKLMVDVGNACRTLVDNGRVTLPFTVRNLKAWGNATLNMGDLTTGFADAYFDLLAPSEAIAVNEVFHKLIGKRVGG